MLNDNNQMKAKLAEIDKHSRMCFHGKVIPMNHNSPQCCCGHIKECHGECEPVRKCCKRPNVGATLNHFDSTRSMVQASHNQLRQSVCIQSRVNTSSQPSKCYLDNENESNHDKLHEEAHSTKDMLRKLQETNHELKRQIQEITQQKVNLKQKLDYTQKQFDILLSNTTKSEKIDHSKIQELIVYIESQRDIYRNSVEQLLNKLDPQRISKLAHEIDNTEGISDSNNQFLLKKPAKVILKSKTKHRQLPSNISYSQSMPKSSKDNDKLDTPQDEIFQEKEDSEVMMKYSPKLKFYEGDVDQRTKDRADSILEEILRGNNNSTDVSNDKLEKANCKIANLEEEIQELSAKLEKVRRESIDNVERQNHDQSSCCKENSRLNKEIVDLRQHIEEVKLRDSLQLQKNKQYISDIRDSTDDTIEGLQQNLRLFQNEINTLKSQLQTKESHLHSISREKDYLQNQLDDKTTQLEDLKSKYRNEKSQLVS